MDDPRVEDAKDATKANVEPTDVQYVVEPPVMYDHVLAHVFSTKLLSRKDDFSWLRMYTTYHML